jgi:hypothetical protein
MWSTMCHVAQRGIGIGIGIGIGSAFLLPVGNKSGSSLLASSID